MKSTTRTHTGGGPSGPLAAPIPADDTPRQYVTFHVDDGLWGIPLEDVQEITRMPNLVRVPRSSRSLQGLANLRGRVLPVASLRRLLRFDDQQPSEATRVVVLDRSSPIGFVVDRMAALVTVAPDRIETADAVGSDVAAEFLQCTLKDSHASGAVRILDVDRLLGRDFHPEARRTETVATRSKAPAREAEARSPAARANKLVLVSFKIGRQEYALPLDRVQEIVPLPDSISIIPRAETAVLGVTSLRDTLVPLLSLHVLLGFPIPRATDERPRVLVVPYGRKLVGLVADRTKEILRVDPGLVDSLPSMLNRGEGVAEVQSICRLDGGARLVSVLAPDQLLRADAASAAMGGNGETMEVNMAQRDQAMGDVEQFIVFHLNREEYAVPIAAVDEVTRVPDELTRIPKAPTFIEGLMNLRGAVVPVVDQRRRLDLPAASWDARARIVVITFDGLKAGFLVDGVSELLKIPRAAIGPAPELSEDQFRLISRVANLEDQNRMILIVDAPALLNREELGLLKGLRKAEREPAS
jgi:purine-binding chemotaxis protein CheW